MKDAKYLVAVPIKDNKGGQNSLVWSFKSLKDARLFINDLNVRKVEWAISKVPKTKIKKPASKKQAFRKISKNR